MKIDEFDQPASESRTLHSDGNGKRLVLLLDGTWNDDEAGATDTNIVRLRELIARTLWKRSEEAAPTGGKVVHGFDGNTGREHIVFYERGVGTGPFDRFRGGIFGDGLAANVRRAYKFLSFYYKPGDQVFVFGFSRGAYTARSLVGYVAAAGLLRLESCTERLEETAWSFYRTPPNDRLPGVWFDLGRYTHDRSALRISCLGVFDTVGALGIPSRLFSRTNRARFEFHNVFLPSITDVNLHALAIDEHRAPFEATLWRRPKFKQFASKTEQVWFPGAHSDIGGGYIPEESRRKALFPALDDIPLDWMVKRLLYHFNDFPIDIAPFDEVDESWAMAPLHNSRSLTYRIYPLALRSIANSVVPVGRRQFNVSRERHEEQTSERIHISALKRLGKSAPVAGRATIDYVPPNVKSVLEALGTTYKSKMAPTKLSGGLTVVDWNGCELRPDVDNDRKRVLDLLNAC